MENEELQQLKALALAATPGPWLHRHDPGNPAGCQHGVKLPGEFGTWIGDYLDNADCSTDDGVAGQRNAAFIAAANPATVLAMIERIEADAADVARLDFVLDNSAFICTIDHGMYQLMMQDEDEEYHVMSGDGEAFRTKRAAIDAAMLAAVPAGIAS